MLAKLGTHLNNRWSCETREWRTGRSGEHLCSTGLDSRRVHAIMSCPLKKVLARQRGFQASSRFQTSGSIGLKTTGLSHPGICCVTTHLCFPTVCPSSGCKPRGSVSPCLFPPGRRIREWKSRRTSIGDESCPLFYAQKSPAVIMRLATYRPM